MDEGKFHFVFFFLDDQKLDKNTSITQQGQFFGMFKGSVWICNRFHATSSSVEISQVV